MGWLDHSTNNIILDAVLTDLGRQKLSSGQFKITQFSVGDDEVDYGIIQKYGRAVGKEKIEKNTPVFEAMTNESVALKYRLVSTSLSTSVSATKLPTLSLVTQSTARIATKNNTRLPIRIDLKLGNTTDFSNNTSLLQGTYTVKVSDRFFTVLEGTASTSNPGDPSRNVTYTVTASAAQNATNESLNFTLQAKTLDSTTLQIYGKNTGTANLKQIDTYVTVVGKATGCSITFPVSIQQSIV